MEAASLAATLRADGHDARDLPGERSQYDVVADGRLVFSKQRKGRFPDADEIRAALGAG